MSVHIKLSSTLRPYVPGYDPVTGLEDCAAGTSIENCAKNLGLPLEQIKFAMLNGRLAKMDDILKDGDRLAFFPAVGGG